MCYVHREVELSDTKLQNLPDYVESLSCIMVELDTVTKEQLTSLQYLTVILIENFPKLLSVFHVFAIRAISAALCNLVQVGGTVLDDFLANLGKSNFDPRNISVHIKMMINCTSHTLI